VALQARGVASSWRFSTAMASNAAKKFFKKI